MVSTLKLLFCFWKRFSENVVIFLTQLLVSENQVWNRKVIVVWVHHVRNACGVSKGNYPVSRYVSRRLGLRS